ncbi:GntR family transcriptional regulator [Bacillus sp. B1-b2]|uniref:GntR family transcriptional regulator n=1 Tax=Bacillus sp. B1-b2 TaxID=2653201 RepID=UPI0018697B17|nr:GntR family transcriptional regulator [Bacillus sp. B1-b2]
MKNISQITRLSLREQIYDQLKAAIIQLELKPGERINDKLLAEQFGVSRTPVREALKKLEDDGLIVTSPGSETTVSLIDQAQAQHAFVIVASLHALAAKLAAPHLTEQHVRFMQEYNKELLEAVQRKDRLNAIKSDDQFHYVILEAANNPEIITTLNGLLPKIRRLELLKFNSLDGLSSVEQHNSIIDYILSGKKEELPTLLEKNWLSLAHYLTENKELKDE